MKKTRHNARLNLRCSAEFKTYLEQNAAELGISVTEFIRRSVQSTTITHHYGLRELVPIMRRHGNNLNQIAWHLNSGGAVNREIAVLLAEYRQTIELLYKIACEERGE